MIGFRQDRDASGFALRLLDATALIALGLVAYAIRHESLDIPGPYWAAIGLGAIVHLAAADTLGLYRAPLDRLRERQSFGHAVRPFTSLAITLAVLVGVAYLAKISDQYSRAWVVLWLGATGLAMIAGRVLLARLARTHPARRAIIGTEEAIGRMGPAARRAELGIAAIILLPTSTERLIADLGAAAPDEILILAPLPTETDAVRLRLAVGTTGARVRYCLETHVAALAPPGVALFAGIPAIDVVPPPLGLAARAIKRVMDLALGILFLGLAALPMLAVALLIRLDGPGPIFFRQRRQGRHGRPFVMLKFRTMATSAGADPRVLQARADDPRVTPIGRILRRWSLDELPQLLNVLRGDMSLVGPRPHAMPHEDQFGTLVSDYVWRRRMKPGVTGWAQINGARGPAPTIAAIARRVELDIAYVDNWSVAFDLKILALTIPAVVGGEAAL